MKAVEFRDVSFRYNENSPVILRKVNFSMEYGKTVLITGASGTGKTTIMSLINGTIPNYTEGQLAGTVLVNGESTAGKSIAELSVSVGSVLQNADLQIVHLNKKYGTALVSVSHDKRCIEPLSDRVINLQK